MKYLTVTLCMLMLIACVKHTSLNGPVIWSNNSLDTITETALPIHTPRTIQINSNVKGYYETLPSLYSKTTKRYPLIVFIHGIGELNKTLSALNCCGLPYHASRGTFPPSFTVNNAKYSFVVVSPQFIVRPSAAEVQSVVDYAKTKYRIDPNRVYVTGLSMGGGSTMDWAMVYGEKAAAIFPSCPGTSPTDARAKLIASKNLPIWWTYGGADNLVPPSQGYTWQKLIDGYNPAYAPFTKLTVWDGLSHNQTWAKAFNPLTKVDGKNAYEWLLQYKRDGNIPPVARAGNDRTIDVSWNYMPTVFGTTSTDADGWIAKFNWRQISGATCTIATPTSGSTKITGLVAGTYVFRLTVTDNKGATATDDIKITMTL
jgi:poly(3-hydroxybutyrate) depolymerase